MSGRLLFARERNQMRSLSQLPVRRGVRGALPAGILHLQGMALCVLKILPGPPQPVQGQERRLPRVRHPQRGLYPRMPVWIHHHEFHHVRTGFLFLTTGARLPAVKQHYTLQSTQIRVSDAS